MPPKNSHLQQSVFPELTWQDDEWLGKMTLGPWHTIELSINPKEHGQPVAPTEEQEAAYQHLLECTPDVVAALIFSLEKYYKRMRPRYLDFLGTEAAQLMPELSQATDLVRLIDLIHVYIHAEAKNGSAYVGFHFDCTWEKEHGLGCIMHLNKVLEVDSADISFSWSPE
ncbi:DUF6985 domain-containing protein [Prosthecobacter sp.]|uniref:DUF6985 domain-containing protein n=1 Tax=Prosthecobacter sp. TaxID=1965333 RepID=UPI003783F82F